MGWVTLNNGETVHTSQLCANPIVKSETIKTYKRKGVQYWKIRNTFRDGTEMIVTLSCTQQDLNALANITA